MDDAAQPAVTTQAQWTTLVRRFESNLPSQDLGPWAEEIHREAVGGGLSTTTTRSVLGRLAWLGRDARLPLPTDLDPPAALDDGPALVWCWYLGERLRYDFRFRELSLALMAWRRRFPADGLLVAFDAFARFGMRDARARELCDLALAAPDCDDRVQSVCLHGVSFGLSDETTAELAVGLADEMLAVPNAAAHVLHYRKAMALRALGRLDDAVQSVDRALAEIDPTDQSFLEIHQDYVRERELILAREQLDAHTRRMISDFGAQAVATVEAKLADAERTISDSLLKLVEILGLFVTLAGFVAASGALFSRAGSWEEMAVSLVLVAVGSLAFFLVLRLVVGGRRRR